MKNLIELQRAAVLVLLLALPVAARAHKSEAWARSQFATAEHLHQSLEARPAQELTRADFDRVINAYRRVYFEAPASTKADPSVVAVAQLLEEMGRRFEDGAILHSAIQQYEFLRRQYPGSKARFGALFHIGEIYKDDLHDKRHADEAFQEFLRRYPRNQFAEEARKALAEPIEKAAMRSNLKPKTAAKTKSSDQDEEESAADIQSGSSVQDTSGKDSASGGETGTGKLARITGIRHWSTPDSTHVAIDLQRAVRYDAQKIDHPDRIFFDLFDTKLDSTLARKAFDVDEGLLKKIRISQFNPRQTRVVLEIGGRSNFQASLLSNPPRLVIDVWDKQAAKAGEKEEVQASEAKTENSLEPRLAIRAGRPETVESDLPDTIPTKELPEGRAAAVPKPAKSSPTDQKPRGNVTVITSDGVKKTIVDADDDGSAKPAVARLEAPEIRPASEPIPTKLTRDTRSRGKQTTTAENLDAREAQPTAAGDRSLIRALGLKIGKIVIDPGHGGHDTGTIGPNGLEEKELVLDVSKRLGKLLASRLGAQVIYTRADDTFVPLETRTAIANQEGADLFVSVHANSSRDSDARGVETYYLNFTSSPEALEVAARENAVSEKSIHELQDLVKKIALKEKIEESREFAVDVDRSLHSGLAAKNAGVRDRGVKKAPFIVLIGANMPS
ncbi:MAG TPA: N-acetylmuramoyl-L-alanine amidase, partial [Terriglobales bacterium]|nr:N-acetylmuramoyl-L-alanine amidase [Terriglobales bacterium]